MWNPQLSETVSDTCPFAFQPHSPLSAGVRVTMGLTGWMLRGGGSAALGTLFSASFKSVKVTPCQQRAKTKTKTLSGLLLRSELFVG